jgi:hypothetical protein
MATSIGIFDNLPKNHANKVQRVKFGKRLGVSPLTGQEEGQILFEAKCPQQGSSLSTPVENMQIIITAEKVAKNMIEIVGGNFVFETIL